jgi:lipoprotein-anchoring transpeptidase ErfK/SrfK
VASAVVVLSVAGCSSAPEPGPTHSRSSAASATSTPVADATPRATSGVTAVPDVAASSLVATADVASVAVLREPDGATLTTLDNPQANGTPLVFAVSSRQDGWVQVQVPVRPNGTTGWVRASDVTIATVAYHLVAMTATNRLLVFDAGKQVAEYPIATGTGGTPTPHGSFYLTELLKPTNAGYGPFAYGISAYSEVLNSFGGGPGQIGMHGTDDASSVGTAASHGCIRLHDADITTLSTQLPLGTPITIV